MSRCFVYLFKKTKKILTIVLVVISLGYLTFSSINNEKMKTENNYEYVDNDPLNARVYTLENGLKVYLTSYADAPRVQTNIAVRAGSKNDPEDATGLAHYLEHMLFKGTDVYGSLDYEKEKPLLDQIESLYEEYRSIEMTDTVNRDRVWEKIDSISGEAAKFAIEKALSTLSGSLDENSQDKFLRQSIKNIGDV